MKKQIMIIEDEKDFHEMYAMTFKDEGYNLIHAFDGEEAMQLLEESRPDLIILDMVMDMVTGDTVFLHLKGMQEFADIPVIIVSSMPEKKYLGLKKIDPDFTYVNKEDLTKDTLLKEVKKRLGL
ncbi:MAG: response regulator [Candidatus Brocadiaceae bacterium]|nr:response regulator [Candidatus Brocadiaceae bacterium]